MKIIGICGKIGSGKSAAGVFLEELGGFVLDLDVEMHTLYAESCELQQKIAETVQKIDSVQKEAETS